MLYYVDKMDILESMAETFEWKLKEGGNGYLSGYICALRTIGSRVKQFRVQVKERSLILSLLKFSTSGFGAIILTEKPPRNASLLLFL